MTRRGILAGSGVLLSRCRGLYLRRESVPDGDGNGDSNGDGASDVDTHHEARGGRQSPNHGCGASLARSRRRSTEDGHKWVVLVTLRLKPQATETAAAYPIGVFFIFFDSDGEKLYREYEQVGANTGATSRTVTPSHVFSPANASFSTFDRSRIDLVHA